MSSIDDSKFKNDSRSGNDSLSKNDSKSKNGFSNKNSDFEDKEFLDTIVLFLEKIKENFELVEPIIDKYMKNEDAVKIKSYMSSLEKIESLAKSYAKNGAKTS